MTKIDVLGPLRIDGADVSGPRDRVVLAALTTRSDRALTADELAQALWGDDRPASANKVVQGCIARLRKTIGADAIETTPQGYRLVVGDDDVDARRFEGLLLRGRELLSLGQPERAAHVLATARSLWSGPPFGELEEWDLGRVEAERLRALLAEAEELGIEAALRAGRHSEVIAEAQRLVAAEPLREQRWGLLARAEYQSGRQAEALRTLRRARAHLQAEVGLDLAPDLVMLEDAILNQDPGLAVDALEAEPSSTCPYPGLVAYGVADREGFFGRERDVEECRQRLRSTGVLAVLGPSGSGKSSLVRAGVGASLMAQGRSVSIITPGRRPLDSVDGLADDAVLIVDQLEEAVTLCDDPHQRDAFFDFISQRADQHEVVLVLRADRLGEVSVHPGMAGLFERGLFLVRPMAAAELRAAVEGPARQAGLLLEPGLAELLLREVEGQPGALPLLSHALRATWEHREGRTLTVAGYRATGGMSDAVARSAEQMFASLEPRLQPVVRDLMMRLVVPSTDREPVRAPMPIRVLSQDADRGAVIQRLTNARLITADDQKIELAHEALTTAWPRFRTWLDEDVDGQRLRRHLTLASDEWDRLDRPDSELYRGVRLSAAVEWAARSEVGLTTQESDFLTASQEQAEREEQTAERRAAQQARQNRQLRLLLAGAVGLLLVALAAGALLVRERDRADEAATAADARRIGAQALVVEDLDRSLLLAVEAVRLDDSLDTRTNLQAVLARNPLAITSSRTETPRWNLEISPDGERLFASGPDQLEAIDADSFDVEMVVDFESAAIALSPDGETLAAADPYWTPSDVPDFDGVPIRLYDPTSLEELPRLADPPTNGIATSLSFSSEGRLLAAGFAQYEDGANSASGGSVAIWDRDEPARAPLIIELPDQGSTADGLALSGDGSRVYVAAHHDDGLRLLVFDASTGRLLDSVDTGEPARALGSVTISPDGALLAMVEHDDVVLRATSDLSVVNRLDGHRAGVFHPTFSHDGTRLATASEDGTIKLWDVATGRLLFDFEGHSGPTRGVTFSLDDRLLYSAGLDRVILTWDLQGDRSFVPLVAELSLLGVEQPRDYRFGPGEPSHDRTMIAYPQHRVENQQLVEAGLQILDLETGEVSDWLDTEHIRFGDVAWSPDDTRLITTGDDGMVRVWEATTGVPIASASVADGPVVGVDINDRGDRIFVGEWTGELTALDSESLEPVGRPVSIDGEVFALLAGPESLVVVLTGDGFAVVDLEVGEVVFEDAYTVWGMGISPDGTRVAIGTGTGEVGLLDVEARQWIVPPDERAAHRAAIAKPIDFSPDGDRYVTGSRDGRIVEWSSETGRPITVVPEMFGQFAEPWFGADGESVIISANSRPEPAVFRRDVRLDADTDAACAIAGRNLTEEEWAEFLGDRPYRLTCPQLDEDP